MSCQMTPAAFFRAERVIAVLRGRSVWIAFLLLGLSPAMLPAQECTELTYTRVQEQGRLLVPMRVIFEALNMQVEWDAQERIVYAYDNDTLMALKIDDAAAVLMDRQTNESSTVDLDVPARLIGGVTFVPLRFVAEASGAEVDYHGDRVVISDGDGNAVMIIHIVD